jgi:hypothetical protein
MLDEAGHPNPMALHTRAADGFRDGRHPIALASALLASWFRIWSDEQLASNDCRQTRRTPQNRVSSINIIESD